MVSYIEWKRLRYTKKMLYTSQENLQERAKQKRQESLYEQQVHGLKETRKN